MTDHLEQQLVNELRALLQPLNEKYKDFFHLKLITLCDLDRSNCESCAQSETEQKCKRCVIGFSE